MRFCRLASVIVNSINPWVFRMTDPTKGGVEIRGVRDGTGRALEVFDWTGAPIAGVSQAGGMWVAGDNFRVLWPSVFDAAITLWKEGAITLGGPLGPTFYGGDADPNVREPQHGKPFRNGDRYFQSIQPYSMLTYTNGMWT